MAFFGHPEFDDHEEIVVARDARAGLSAIIAVHDTTLGPACGGTRMFPYADDAAAITDVLRLSRAMSYKNAMAGLALGGGKAVILGDPASAKTPEMLRAYGARVERLAGRYVTAMDVGMGPADMQVIAGATRHVAGFTQAGKTGGDSGPLTALGCFVGLKAAVAHRLRTDDLKGLRVAVQGLGAVGFELCRHLHQAGARLVVSDIYAPRVAAAEAEFGAKAVGVDALLRADVDVLAPCALGGVITDESIAHLKATVVAGGANNQLAAPRHGALLQDKGVLYAPDYVINAGGVIRVAGQIFGWPDADIEARVRRIGETLSAIFVRAEAERRPTSAVADFMARERIAAGRPPARKAAE